MAKANCLFITLLFVISIQIATSFPRQNFLPEFSFSSSHSGPSGNFHNDFPMDPRSYAPQNSGSYYQKPHSSPYGNNAFDMNIQQHIAQLQAQQLEFQRHTQAQIVSLQQAIWNQGNQMQSIFNHLSGAASESNGVDQQGTLSPNVPDLSISSRGEENEQLQPGNNNNFSSSSSSSSSFVGSDGVQHGKQTVKTNVNGKTKQKTVEYR